MRRSNYGTSSMQRQSVLKPRNSYNTPNDRKSSGQQQKKLRSSTDGSSRMPHLFARLTPVRSSIPRITPLHSNIPSSNTLAPPSSVKKSSMDHGKSSSIGGKNRKDTRPVGDSSFKSECIDKILDFLHNGCSFQVDRRMLLNPHTKNFIDIFNFIYGHFEHNYKLPKKFEEEIPRLLKLMNYPGQISKSSFIPVGSQHTWPAVLAMMAWLIDSIGIYSGSGSFVQSCFSDFDTESALAEKRLDKIVQLCVCENNPDLMEEHLMDYVHTVELILEVRLQDIIEHQERVEKLEEEIDILSNGPLRLSQLRSQFDQFMNDKEKLLSFNKELQILLSRRDSERAQLESQLKQVKLEVQEIDEEVLRLEKEKEKQGFSAEQLAEFKNHARDVASLINQLQSHGKDLDSQIWSLEMSLGKSQKDLSGKVSTYNAIVSQLDHAEGLEIVCGNISENIQYWKKNVRELNEYKKNLKQEIYEAQKQKMRKDEELAVVQEAQNEKKNEYDKLETKLKRMEEDIIMTQNEHVRERKEMEIELERLYERMMETRKEHKSSLHQLQNSLEEARNEFESTKTYGKSRICSGYEFIVKVCHATIDDLDSRVSMAVDFRQGLQKYCDGLLENIKSKTADVLEKTFSLKYTR